MKRKVHQLIVGTNRELIKRFEGRIRAKSRGPSNSSDLTFRSRVFWKGCHASRDL